MSAAGPPQGTAPLGGTARSDAHSAAGRPTACREPLGGPVRTAGPAPRCEARPLGGSAAARSRKRGGPVHDARARAHPVVGGPHDRRRGRMLLGVRCHRQVAGRAASGAAAGVGALGIPGARHADLAGADDGHAHGPHQAIADAAGARRPAHRLVAVLHDRTQIPAAGRRDGAQLPDADAGDRAGDRVPARAADAGRAWRSSLPVSRGC